MGRRYSRRRDKQINLILYTILALIIIIIVKSTIIFIEENPIILFFGFIIIIAILCSKIYLYSKKLENEKIQREQDVRKSRTINELLNRFKNKPTDFEKYVADVYNMIGYETHVTKPTNDGGKDIIMYKNDLKYVVEVKLYNMENKISREKIQKFHSAKIDSQGDRAIFVTTSDFKKTSIEYAAKHDIELVNGEGLVRLIDEALDESH